MSYAETTSTYTLSTTCICMNEDGTYTEYCEGCFEADHAELTDALDLWLEENEITSVEITGKAMGWTRATGKTTVEATSEAILKALTLNGDYCLEVSIPEFDLAFSAIRYSHDEPTGATFEIEAYSTCPDSSCDGECNYNFCANISEGDN
jgi:hypothetical protein